MPLANHDRISVLSFEWSLRAVIVLVSAMWLATLADHFLGLGWGWDKQIIWVAPIIVIGALVTRTLGRVIFRAMGSID